jgi:hypothetical protein
MGVAPLELAVALSVLAAAPLVTEAVGLELVLLLGEESALDSESQSE